MLIHDDPDGFPMISGLFGPPTEFRLSVGPWQECEPLGGTYACGDGISRRTVNCYDDENYPKACDGHG